MTGDFLFGVACGVGGCVLFALVGSLLGLRIGSKPHSAGYEDPCSDL